MKEVEVGSKVVFSVGGDDEWDQVKSDDVLGTVLEIGDTVTLSIVNKIYKVEFDNGEIDWVAGEDLGLIDGDDVWWYECQ